MRTRKGISRVEALENRKLLSATAAVVDGTLTITGTEAHDAVLVSLHHGDATKLDVRLNGKLQSFNLADISGVNVSTLGGADTVLVSEKNGKIYLPFIVDGGDGNDVITTGSGNDVIDAGAGNDVVNGGGGDDQINGDAGNDKLMGGSDNDVVDAGPGRDVVNGGGGTNNLDGGTGKDTIQVTQGTNSVAADPTNPHETTGRTDKKVDLYQVSTLDQMSAALTQVAADAVPGAVVYRVELNGDQYTLCYRFGTDPTTYRAIVTVTAGTGDVELVSREVSLQEARPAAIAAFNATTPNLGLISINQAAHGNFTIRYRDMNGNTQETQTTTIDWGLDDASEDADNDGYYDPHDGDNGFQGDGQNNNGQNNNPNAPGNQNNVINDPNAPGNPNGDPNNPGSDPNAPGNMNGNSNSQNNNGGTNTHTV